MKYFSFSDKEKIKIFDEIAGHFYERNFGSLTKTDFELMMFGFYYKKMKECFKDKNGAIDYIKCSDYRISKDLGITQQKVRNLKVKYQLVSEQDEYDWKDEFVKLIGNARIDNNKMIINIPDPNLYLDIQNFLEENGGFVEKQLNNKLLQIRIEYFIDLLLAIEPENNKKEIIERIKQLFKEQTDNEIKLNEESFGRKMIDSAVDISTILSNISSLISPSNFIFNAIRKLF